MAPTLRHGDVLLVRRGAPIRPGDVVLARFRSMPDRFVIKRADHELDGGWFLRSDNPAAGGDSYTNGVADVEARAVLIWRANERLKRIRVPRRVARPDRGTR
jgi:phage repressor protein C with HTH and peptisase S24 domain